jgi:protein involved in polysaccharide export with SLBB domain
MFAQARLFLLAIALAGVLLTLRLAAQCPGGADPDALGCAVLPDKSTDPLGSPASVSIQEGSVPASPSPDNSSLASAVRSLSAGASHAERSMGLSGSSQAAPRALPPEPLNEFQRFVSATTGHTLAIFGASLFNSMPASFGPLDHGPAPGELIVGTDDELRIRIWGQVNFSADLRVSREGEIYIPKVGAVHLAGLPFSVIAAHLREAVDRVYRNYELSVDMGEIHSIQIYVTGHAHRPGEYTVSALSTLVDTVFTCGGPSSEGTMRHILLKREGKVVADFDLYALLVSGDKTGDMQLEAGDVLFISPVGPQVALFGSVRQSAIFELRGAESIAGLLDAAGGTTALATNAQLSLERIENHSRTAFVLAADNEGLATPLADGDILRVDPILPDYRQTVTLRGAVANPGRFRWHEGMRLSELMPEKDALVKRNYWWRRTQLGLPAPEFASLSTSASSAPEPASLTAAETSASSQPKPVSAGEAAAETNWNNAIVERLNPATMTTTLLSFGVGKLVLDHDQSQDLTLMPGDVITIFSQAEIPIPIREQTKYVTLQGEFVHPGVYSVGAGETLNSVVARAGGLTPQAYLYAASFTRRSTQALEQHRLNEFADQAERQLLRTSVMPEVAAQSTAGRQTTTLNRELVARIRSVRATGRIVLNMKNDRAGHYDLPDMSLEDGDEIVVPFTPETVEVEGAVFNPHAFLFQSGATVGAYLRLAGGPSRYADRKRILVLRADGTVISRIASGSLFARGLDNLTLNPGDGILVPEKNLKLSPMNLALLWTQALSQTSMSALEANALTR